MPPNPNNSCIKNYLLPNLQNPCEFLTKIRNFPKSPIILIFLKISYFIYKNFGKLGMFLL